MRGGEIDLTGIQGKSDSHHRDTLSLAAQRIQQDDTHDEEADFERGAHQDYRLMKRYNRMLPTMLIMMLVANGK